MRQQLGNTSKVTCPACTSIDCVRADRHGWRDSVSQVMGKFPWMCRRCLHRFYLTRSSIA